MAGWPCTYWDVFYDRYISGDEGVWGPEDILTSESTGGKERDILAQDQRVSEINKKCGLLYPVTYKRTTEKHFENFINKIKYKKALSKKKK
jgi:hypothetical protein